MSLKQKAIKCNMASVDAQIENIQNKIIYFFIANEQYFNEYMTIPFFYTWLFNSNCCKLFRSFILSILIFRNLFQKANQQKLKFETIFFILFPYLAYSVFSDIYKSALFYTLFYSQNFYESLFLSIITTYLSQNNTIQDAYLFHIGYIILRNNVKLQIKSIGNSSQSSVNIILTFYRPPTFNQRLQSETDTINDFLNNSAESIKEMYNN